MDERLSVYGAETNTGVRFVVVLDMAGRREVGEEEPGKKKAVSRGGLGVRDGEVKVVSLLFLFLPYIYLVVFFSISFMFPSHWRKPQEY